MQITTENFIEKAKKIHGDKYDYSKTTYIKALEKVTIICNTCKIEFTQTPANHTQGQGCPECSKNKISTTNEILEIIPKEYSVTFMEGTKNKDTLHIYCKKHDHYTARTIEHLKVRKTFCSICTKEKSTVKTKNKAEKDFFTAASKIHKNKYDYSLSLYISATDKIKIKCTECNHIFEQIPHNHKRGAGCPECAADTQGWGKTRFKDKPTVFYVIQIGSVFKIGITTKSVEKRYKSEVNSYSIFFQTTFFDGSIAWMLEKKILAANRQYKYTGTKVLKTAANKEIVTQITHDKIQQAIKDIYAIL